MIHHSLIDVLAAYWPFIAVCAVGLVAYYADTHDGGLRCRVCGTVYRDSMRRWVTDSNTPGCCAACTGWKRADTN